MRDGSDIDIKNLYMLAYICDVVSSHVLGRTITQQEWIAGADGVAPHGEMLPETAMVIRHLRSLLHEQEVGNGESA